MEPPAPGSLQNKQNGSGKLFSREYLTLFSISAC